SNSPVGGDSLHTSNEAWIDAAGAAGQAGVDGAFLQRWERLLVTVLTVGLGVAVVGWFLARANYASTRLEYVLKFDPLFIDGSVSSILDFNGVGDPRGRVVNSVFTW